MHDFEREMKRYQDDLGVWAEECFGVALAVEPHERALRFAEEALELIQTQGVTAGQAHQLVDYVFGRPTGEARQEVGGVMVTFGLLCHRLGINAAAEGNTEFRRIWEPEIMNKIRRKQVSKNLHGIGGSPEAAELAETIEFLPGVVCGVCGARQFETSSGVTCEEGHGGAESIPHTSQTEGTAR